MSAFPTEIQDHVIRIFESDFPGPTLVAVGSIHGNEPSGRLALERIAARLTLLKSRLRGKVCLLVGNVRGLRAGVRFIDSDLNRHWTPDNLRTDGEAEVSRSEDHELHELLLILRDVIYSAVTELYILDLHTTSAGGLPFATVGDTLRNRRFAQALPVTILLGIEEQLEGTMLEFLNNEGAITLGFEAGQHLSNAAIENHEALVLLSLVNAGILAADDLPDIGEIRERLSAATGTQGLVEVLHRESVSAEDDFVMNAGFKNFDPIIKGQPLAENRGGVITAPMSGMILMPLYQKLGEDGFFIVRAISPFWLKVSEILRRLGIPDLIDILPGVKCHPKRPEVIRVNTRIARFFPLQIFHLLGFRKLRQKKNFLMVSRRRYDTESPFHASTEGTGI